MGVDVDVEDFAGLLVFLFGGEFSCSYVELAGVECWFVVEVVDPVAGGFEVAGVEQEEEFGVYAGCDLEVRSVCDRAEVFVVFAELGFVGFYDGSEFGEEGVPFWACAVDF